MVSLSPSTWRLLGLSVAAGYASLGLLEIVFPGRAGLEPFLIPEMASKPKGGNPTRTSATTEPSSSVHPAAMSAGNTAEDVVPLLMPLLGARDVSIALALFTYAYLGKSKEMGVLIVAGTFLCAADVYMVWKKSGAKSGSLFAAGATIWTAFGVGMLYQG